MKMKKKFLLVFILFFVFGFIANVSAITASLGNSRMVLRAGVGETIEKSLLVRNSNDVSVNIQLTIDGDLAENVVLKEPSFELASGEDKKAFFTIRANEEGTTTTKINVAFNPDDGNGVGLTSTVILIAADEYAGTNENIIDGEISGNVVNSESNKISTKTMLAMSTLVLITVVLTLFLYASKNKKKKGLRRPVD
jgi:hypothetical protein